MKRQRVKTELPEAVVNRHDVLALIRRIARSPQGYITLASVGEGRKEHQLGRLDLRRNLPILHWVSDGVAFVLNNGITTTLRLRWWRSGGKPVEGVMLRLADGQPGAFRPAQSPKVSKARDCTTDWSSKKRPVPVRGGEDREPPPLREERAFSGSQESAWRLMADKAEARLKEAVSARKSAQAQQVKLTDLLAKATDEVKGLNGENQRLRSELAEYQEAFEIMNRQNIETLAYLDS